METDPLLFKEERGGRRRREEEKEDPLTDVDDRGTCRNRACSVIVIWACFVILCTQGIDYVFGNLNPYLTSYLRNSTYDDDVDYTDTLWIIQTYSVTSSICQPLVGPFGNRMSVKLFMLIGVLFQAAFLFGSYWAVRTSFWAIWFTYGIVGGIPSAFLYPTCLKISAAWVPDKKGFVMGLILMGYGFGALVWNGLITWYINRNNLQPDLKVGTDLYYTQSAVLDKVPSCFLVLGIVFASVQVFFLFFISTPPSRRIPAETVINVNETEDDVRRTPNTSNTEGEQDVLERPKHDASNNPHRPEYHWKEVLKSRVFWSVWCMMLLSSFALSFVIPLFKAYGQTFIADDHFLATVAMASSVCNAVGRPFWGLLADRFGPRMVALIVQCLLAILTVTFSTCQETGRGAFFIWVCAMFLIISGLFTVLPIIVLAAFGPHHFNANMGLMSSYGIIGCILPVLVASPLKTAFGWNGMFLVGFAGLFFGILLNMSIDLSTCGNSIPHHMFDDLSIRR